MEIETRRKDSMEKARGTYGRLYRTDATVVFNRESGLFVFDENMKYIKKRDMLYYNTDPRCNKIYKQEKYLIGKTGYTDWALITLCLYFGRYNPQTGDYIISKPHDEGKWNAEQLKFTR